VPLTPESGAEPVGAEAADAELADDAGWDTVALQRLQAALERIAGPERPLVAPWGVSVGDLVARAWDVPRPAKALLRQLNRFGAVRLSPDGVGMDDDDVAWDRLVEVHLASLIKVLQEDAVERELVRLGRFLPPVPGRTWLLRRVSRVVSALVTRFTPRTERESPLVPFELVRRGRAGRLSTVGGGVVSALLWAAVPEASAVLVAECEERGVLVTRP